MRLHHKTPISFVLALLANILLIVVFEILVMYRFPSPPTEALLRQFDSRYEGCRVYADTNLTADRDVRFFLVETQDGQKDLIPLRQHDFFPSRTRLQPGKIIQNLDLTRSSDTQLLIGANLYRVSVFDGLVHTMMSAGSGFQQRALAKYLGIGAALAFVELLIWEKLRGN